MISGTDKEMFFTLRVDSETMQNNTIRESTWWIHLGVILSKKNECLVINTNGEI